MKEKILILTGDGLPARAALNIYQNKLADKFILEIIEEHNLAIDKIIAFIAKSLKKNGMFATIDILLGKIYVLFSQREIKIKKKYQPNYFVPNINDPLVRQLLRKNRYKYAITNACSILSHETISAFKCKIINVHCGITPRYRGGGNVWAYYENNVDLVGTTVHLIDKGIDTGKRIAVKQNNFLEFEFKFIDLKSFEEGAHLLCQYLVSGKMSIPDSYRDLISAYYSFPGLSIYKKAKKNFANGRDNKKMEFTWQQSFNSRSKNNAITALDKQHWSDHKAVKKHDQLILQLISKKSSKITKILDLGCGDGRYAKLINDFEFYIGCDNVLDIIKLGYPCLEILTPTANHSLKLNILNDSVLGKTYYCPQNEKLFFYESSAKSLLAFKNIGVDLILAIGLFQHLENAQTYADEIIKLAGKNTFIVINTLRQFSKFELLILFIIFFWNKNKRVLLINIWQKNYFSGIKINDEFLARRYSKKELRDLFQHLKDPEANKIYYNGICNTRLMAREMTYAIQL